MQLSLLETYLKEILELSQELKRCQRIEKRNLKEKFKIEKKILKKEHKLQTMKIQDTLDRYKSAIEVAKGSKPAGQARSRTFMSIFRKTKPQSDKSDPGPKTSANS